MYRSTYAFGDAVLELLAHVRVMRIQGNKECGRLGNVWWTTTDFDSADRSYNPMSIDNVIQLPIALIDRGRSPTLVFGVFVHLSSLLIRPCYPPITDLQSDQAAWLEAYSQTWLASPADPQAYLLSVAPALL